jgi:hypothetical protein
MKNKQVTTIYTILLLLITNHAYAQKLGIKPLLGYTYNEVSRSYIRNQAKFSESQTNKPVIMGGLIISYQLSPKYGIETGVQNIAHSLSYRVFDPNLNYPTVSSLTHVVRHRFYHLAFTTMIRELNANNKLKSTVGITVFNVNSNMTSGQRSRYSVDTSIYETFTSLVSSESLTGTNLSWGLMGGIGNEIYLKGNPVGEIRLISRYNFKPVYGAYTNMKFSNATYTNEYITNRFSFEVSFLLNLSSLLGNKWRQ